MNKVSRGMFLICLLSYIPLGWGADNYFSCNTSKGGVSLKTDDHKLIYEMKKIKVMRSHFHHLLLNTKSFCIITIQGFRLII